MGICCTLWLNIFALQQNQLCIIAQSVFARRVYTNWIKICSLWPVAFCSQTNIILNSNDHCYFKVCKLATKTAVRWTSLLNYRFNENYRLQIWSRLLGILFVLLGVVLLFNTHVICNGKCRDFFIAKKQEWSIYLCTCV